MALWTQRGTISYRDGVRKSAEANELGAETTGGQKSPGYCQDFPPVGSREPHEASDDAMTMDFVCLVPDGLGGTILAVVVVVVILDIFRAVTSARAHNLLPRTFDDGLRAKCLVIDALCFLDPEETQRFRVVLLIFRFSGPGPLFGALSNDEGTYSHAKR